MGKILKAKASNENEYIDKACRCSTSKGKAVYSKPCKVNVCNGLACKEALPDDEIRSIMGRAIYWNG
jgi:hypothetical protein